MKELLHLHTIAASPHPLSKPSHFSLPKPSPSFLPFSSSSSSKATSLPRKPPKTPQLPAVPHEDPQSQFPEKALYLDSLGLDLLALVDAHPPIVSAPLSDIKATLDFLRSFGFSAADLRRVCSMCPELLASTPANILPVFTFLLREARVEGRHLRRVILRRPRLLACDVHSRLRPTLYFLQMIGVEDVSKNTSLLSCSVEDKFVPRIEYLQRIGFSRRDALSMFRRFPQLFCYSIKENFEPKFDYFVVEMGRDLQEIKKFPQYFSFSLENRIKPRHRMCVEKGVCFPLPIMLKTNDEKFRIRLEVCIGSSPPLRHSPLWSVATESAEHSDD
ncbi:protein SEEDLING LETHAL 1, chloroplastic-like [Aristolochia californica]|uniref:protein SEEDLING LETHAL 1, chloroplastic-like n=1 Tax=Aristolochia californica TaxID=171875 RepID=UPI0035E31B04